MSVGFGFALGLNAAYAPQQQLQQEDIDLNKQKLAMNQMAMQQAQAQQQTQKAVGAFLQSESAKDQANVTDPVKASQMYQKAAGLALQNGDFASANTMSELANGKIAEAKQQAAVVAQQQQAKKEDLATAADDYNANPTAAGASDLMRKAAAAGVNPSSIPSPGTPQFKTWANQQTLASKTAAQRADFVQKAAEMDATRKEKQQEHSDSMQIRQEQVRATAAYQQGMLQLRQAEEEDRKQRGVAAKAPTTKDIGGNTYQYDPTQQLKGPRDTPDPAWVKIGGPKQSAQTVQTNNAIVASASESVRGLHVIGAMADNVTSGPFAGLHNGTVLEAMTKTGSNAATPESMQMYNVAAQGLGLEVSRVLTLGAGRGANQATINEMQQIVEGHAGDSNATLLFKYANAADIVRNRLGSLPDSPDPKVQAARKETEDTLAKIPTPEQVLATVKDPKMRAKMLDVQSNMSDVASRVADSSNSGVGAATASNSTPPQAAGSGQTVHWSDLK